MFDTYPDIAPIYILDQFSDIAGLIFSLIKASIVYIIYVYVFPFF